MQPKETQEIGGESELKAREEVNFEADSEDYFPIGTLSLSLSLPPSLSLSLSL
jgi:hypothetical protein